LSLCVEDLIVLPVLKFDLHHDPMRYPSGNAL
jgi:hypothetical protein